MRKLMLASLVGIIALTPAIAVAQTTGSGSKAGSSGATTPSTKSGGTTSGGSSSSPAASPSGGTKDMSKIKTKADCDKAGGMWQASASKCEKK